MDVFGNLEGKTAIVCGASMGLGAASARALARLGCKIIGIARSKEILDDAIESLPNPNIHRGIVLDLGNIDEVNTFAKEVSSQTEEVHILVNNAGGPAPGTAMAATPELIYEAFNVHVITNMILSQALVPKMRDAKFGRIINIVSVSARSPVANIAVSNTVRGAVLNWAKTLSRELAPFGITVNSVLPGYTDTMRLQQLIATTAMRSSLSKVTVEDKLLGEIPMGRFGKPEEVAAAVAYLATPSASFTTGTTMVVDGGWTNAT